MKKIISCLCLSSSLIFLTPFALADDHASMESDSSIAEFWYCSLNEGQTMEDMRKVTANVEKFSEENGLKIGQWILQPFSGDMTGGNFVLMVVWPSFEQMGNSFQHWFGEGLGNDGMALFSKAATCNERNFATIEEHFNNME